MEIFKTEIQKKEFERFQKEDLIEILECGYCQKTACQSFDNKFLVSCKFCRENFCKKCHKFDTTKEILLKEVDTVGKEFEECDETTQSTQDSSCYSWSGVSESFDTKGEKQGWSEKLI